MATYRVYKCESCGYTVEANPTGHDVMADVIIKQRIKAL